MAAALSYIGIGALSGFVAGLLGVGGGAISVPLLMLVFTAQHFPPEHLMHLALGTAMCTVVFTSISSVRAHHSHKAVDWPIARVMIPGILVGSFAAALVAGLIPTRALAGMFIAFIGYAATSLLLDFRPKRTRSVPGTGGVLVAGGLIGAASSLLAAGGAFLSVPFLAWCNVPLKRAIGTAAAIGFPIALAGTAGYMIQGSRVEDLPSPNLGFVYLPALLLVAMTSMLLAPLGARVAHRLPVKPLRVIFALVLYTLALRMLASIW
jgi:uncharacterized membrane protein YfcA